MNDTDDDKADPKSLGAAARRLIRESDRASLSSAQQDDGGWPYGSLVLSACDHAGTPLMLLSDLAEHGKNIKADGRVSLLFDGTAGLDDPLTGSRLTVMGRARATGDGRARARYLARHPSARDYAGFGDFNLYRLEVTRAHLVAGFGRIHWLAAGDLLFDGGEAGELRDAEPEILAHMNEHHSDAIALYTARLLGLDGAGWTLTGVDPEGCDLRRGGRVARVEFDRAATDAESARAALVRLVKRARAVG